MLTFETMMTAPKNIYRIIKQTIISMFCNKTMRKQYIYVEKSSHHKHRRR